MGTKSKPKKKKNKKHPGHEPIENEFDKAYDLHRRGRTDEADRLYRMILGRQPNHPDALHLAGLIALEREQFDTALSLITRAIRVYPKAAPYYNNLGTVLLKKGQRDEAVTAYRKALEIDPDYPEAHNNLGTLLKDKIDLTGAIRCFETAVRLNTGFSVAYYNLGTVLCDQGRIPAAVAAYQKALAINPDFFEAHSNLLYTLHFTDTYTPQDIWREHQSWARRVEEQGGRGGAVEPSDPDPDRKLNIGYLSPDFCTHSVAFFIEEVLSHHDRNKVTVFCYSNTPAADDYTQRFRELADHFRDIKTLSDADAAELIRKDRIDILVDLAGHTRNNRLLVCARRPAPIQVTWLGYPDTTGLSAMDYRLTDAVADPVGEADQRHSETLIRLPQGFLCYRPAGEFYPVSGLPMAHAGGVTFGSFNNNSKIAPKVIATWAAILKRVPGSRLKLKARSLGDFETRKAVLEGFEDHGIPSERIWFEGYRVTLKEHFLLYGSVDIALDTFPYNGTTTTCEALWMGVPVIALAGDHHVSRVGQSILTHVGLTELIADSSEDYIERAVALARDPERLGALRSSLRGRMIDSPLLDANGFTAELEGAFRAMWRRRIDGHKVQDETEPVLAPVYDINLQALRKHHPHILPLLDESLPETLDLVLTGPGSPNIRVTDETGRARLLYSERDPAVVRSSLSSAAGAIRGKTICVLGAGLFLDAPALLDLSGKTNLIVFFEASPAVFRAAMTIKDLSSVLAHPHVRLAIGDAADPYVMLNEERDRMLTLEPAVFLEDKKVVGLSPEWYKIRKTMFERFLGRRQTSLHTTAVSGKHFLENSFRNLPAMAVSRPIGDLRGRFGGCPAILVAAGPSLSKNVHHLTSVGDKALIIAADSALAPLMARGVTPHMVVSVDNNDFTFEKLAPFIDALADVDLVYLSTVTPKIPNGIRFKAMYYTFPDAVLQALFGRLFGREGADLEDIHSVIHLALAAAQVSGCDPIIFTGLDLAFSGNRDHADGTLLHWGNDRLPERSVVMVEGVDGAMVPTLPGFVGMLEICRRMIRTVPDRTYIDATEGGAKIKGTIIQPLEITLNSLGHSGVDRARPEAVCFDVSAYRRLQVELGRLHHELERCMERIDQYDRERMRVDEHMEKRGGPVDPASLPEGIRRSVRLMDSINTGLENEPVVLFVKSIMAEFHSRYKELDIRVMENDAAPAQRFAAVMKQQCFVQTVRKNALSILAEEVGKAGALLADIIAFEDPGHDGWEPVVSLIKRFYLVLTETLLESMTFKPEHDCCRGTIALMRAQINRAESLFQNAVAINPSLGPLVSSIKKEAVDNWLTDDRRLPSWRLAQLDRVLELEPGHIVARELKKTMLIDRTRSLISRGLHENALRELSAEKDLSVFHNNPLEKMYSDLVREYGTPAQVIDLVKTTMIDDEKRPGALALVRNTLRKAFVAGGVSMDMSWLGQLASLAGSHIEARLLLQEIFWYFFMDRPVRIIRKTMSAAERNETQSLLETWKAVRDLIPDWFYIESHIMLALGRYEDAELILKKALSLEKDTVRLRGREGTVDYQLGIVALYRGDDDLALERLCDVAWRYPDEAFGLMAALLLARKRHAEKARALMADMVKANNGPAWFKAVREAHLESDLFRAFSRFDALPFLAAYFALVGKSFITGGLTDLGTTFLRAAVNHDPGVLALDEGAWMKDAVQTGWRQEIEQIADDLDKGLSASAEKRLGEWWATRFALDDYHIVAENVIERIHGPERVMAYLEDAVDERADDPGLFLCYARRLFEHGRRDEAEAILDQTASDNGQALVLREQMGDVWLRENQCEKALRMYEKYLSAMPDSMTVLKKIGDVYQRMGLHDAAKMAYETVLAREMSRGDKH
ncbi:hypothetical protein JCM14469_05390 [Desulfatiferula olefinivorans]